MSAAADPAEDDLYGLLGLSRRQRSTYSARNIASAYRRTALLHHPDKSDRADASERFAAIFFAYETLQDTKQRAAYDEHLRGLEEREGRLGREDAGRQKLRRELEQRERVARTWGRERAGKDAMRRMKREVERLRREVAEEERKRQMERLRRLDRIERERGRGGRGSGRRETEDDDNAAWEMVDGWREFKYGVGMDFDEFERDILQKVRKAAGLADGD